MERAVAHLHSDLFRSPVFRLRSGAQALARRTSGWTLIELLIVIAIMAVLVTVTVSAAWRKLQQRAERFKCESNLRSFFVALNAYMMDHEQWPQMPEKIFEKGSRDDYWEWWFDTLKDYQITEDHWLCPTDRREVRANQKPEEQEKFQSSYAPTNFDSGPNTPRAWNQPWLLERGDFHGSGNLMIMPDGSIQAAPWL
jgi:prepilin-type N-terminal cleavage/methylation domain-containing protein